MLNLIKFPIGDWSKDGHGMCDWFIISSNKTVEELQNIHFSCEGELGFDVGRICSEYGESTISGDILETLYKMNILNKEDMESGEYDDHFEPEGVLHIWLEVYKYLDPSFKYEIQEDTIPSINFYGRDSQNRHLYTPGYGLYE